MAFTDTQNHATIAVGGLGRWRTQKCDLVLVLGHRQGQGFILFRGQVLFDMF